MKWIEWFRNLPFFFFPVSRSRAVRIARRRVGQGLQCYEAFPAKPLNLHIYNPPTVPAWYLYCTWNDGLDEMMLRSSRLIIVSKRNGRILYDGSANDEG